MFFIEVSSIIEKLKTISLELVVLQLLTMLRLQQIAKYLREPLSNVTSRLVLKGSGRYFVRFRGHYYAFPSTREVIIPHELASFYSNIFHTKSIPVYSNLSEEDVVKNKSLLNAKVVVLLGHFNHGKTTLLDTLINYSSQNNLCKKNSYDKSGSQTLAASNTKIGKLVDDEKHGITQVCANSTTYRPELSIMLYSFRIFEQD